MGISRTPGLVRAIKLGICETLFESLGLEKLCPCSLCHIVTAQFCLGLAKGSASFVGVVEFDSDMSQHV